MPTVPDRILMATPSLPEYVDSYLSELRKVLEIQCRDGKVPHAIVTRIRYPDGSTVIRESWPATKGATTQ